MQYPANFGNEAIARTATDAISNIQVKATSSTPKTGLVFFRVPEAICRTVRLLAPLVSLMLYHLSKDIITEDLSKERPIWILSAYGPGREAPLQLFGGYPREQSFEEVRLRYYELAASGNQQQANQEAQALVNNAEQQIQTALNDVDGAIKYIVNGAKEHPNRLDICKAKGENLGQPSALGGSQQQVSPFVQASAFGQPSALTAPRANTSTAFGLPSTLSGPTPAFGQPSAPTSTFGQPSAFGQPSTFNRQPSAFGQPSSTFGQPSSFGQSSTLGRPRAGLGQSSSGFGQPTTTALAFGRPTAPSSAFGQPSVVLNAQLKPSPFGTSAAHTAAPPNAFTQATAPKGFPSNTFGQPSQLSQPGAFAQAPAPPTTNPFGQPKPAPPPNPFGSPPATSAPPFPQPAAPSNPFSQAQAPPSSSTNGIFGAGAAAPTPTPTLIPNTNTNTNSTSRTQRDARGLLRSWNNKPITYIDNEPCYKRPDGSWEKVWFPNGAPVFNKTPEWPLEMYDESTKENYRFLREKGSFRGSVMPDLPPRREWCRWEF
ncbi:MAG: hypothetical protein LQ347_002996 [Umbilicaria vellea]|nr:MAG: hypothetical protein LQ347_002996 [Umbilicaria vellea]